MTSERIRRRIDRLLDQADEAADGEDWSLSARRAQEALNLDPDSSDATLLLTSAHKMLGEGSPEVSQPRTTKPPQRSRADQPATPTSFASGRYEVRRFLGEGGKKRVFLAQDSLLDRDVAFALIRARASTRPDASVCAERIGCRRDGM